MRARGTPAGGTARPAGPDGAGLALPALEGGTFGRSRSRAEAPFGIYGVGTAAFDPPPHSRPLDARRMHNKSIFVVQMFVCYAIIIVVISHLEGG